MEQLQIQCAVHKLSLGAVLFSGESYQQITKDSVLKCLDCIIEQHINGKDLISFSELQNSETHSINICNVLPLNPTQATRIKCLQDKYSSINLAQTRKQISDVFQRFLKEVFEKIQSLEKDALMRLDQIEQGLEQLLNPELFKSFKQNLHSTIIAGKGDTSQLNREVISLIQAYKETSVKRFKRVEEDLNDLQQKLFIFREEKANSEINKVMEQFQIENFLEFERNQYLQQIELIKSKIQESEQAIISRNEGGGLIIKNPKRGRILAYTNFIINPKLKYLITIQLHCQSQDNRYHLIGLTDDSLKDNKLLFQQKLTFCSQQDYGLNKKIKGECFQQSLSKVLDCELQIQMCLQDKLFIISDFPKKDNIFALEESTIEDKQYRLGIELHYAEDSMTIKKIEIVKSFPSLI